MDFWSEHMNYGLGSTLTFKCIFLLWFHFNIFYRDSIYDTWYKKYIWIEKTYNKNFNQQIIMDFWSPNLDLIFISPYLGHFLLNWYFFPPNMYVK